jgi:hypothetical protein
MSSAVPRIAERREGRVNPRKACSSELITKWMKSITGLAKEDIGIDPLTGFESRSGESNPSPILAEFCRDGIFGQYRGTTGLGVMSSRLNKPPSAWLSGPPSLPTGFVLKGAQSIATVN